MIIGITGGSGCGKTTVSEIAEKEGIFVADGDKIARIIVEPHSPALSEIKAFFGDEYINADGSLNRRRLGNYVFSHPDMLIKLNELTHKYISEYIFDLFKKNNADIYAIDAAALIESGLSEKCDFIISVLADKEIRKKRIMLRDRISEDEAKKRINAQKKDNFYIENSDFLVYNNVEDIQAISNEVKKIIKHIRSKL